MTEDDATGWPRLLIVEDDEAQLFALQIGLEREQFAVSTARRASEAFDLVEKVCPDVVLLDVMLPGASGIDVCVELRRRGFDMPIIIVSSRAEELDVVLGMEVGADDYVAKPYRLRELVARIGAVLRRRKEAMSAADRYAGPNGSALELRAGGVVLDVDRHEVRVDGAPVRLTLREFEVLRELLANVGRVVTRDELIDRIWGLDFEGDTRIVATLVGRLRSRIELPPAPHKIVTIRGVGYRFDEG